MWHFAQQAGEGSPDDEVVKHLIVPRSGQYVFKDIVEHYLQQITFDDDKYARMIRLPQYRGFGQPIFNGSGVKVADALGPLRAGETLEAVAADYGVSEQSLRDALRAPERSLVGRCDLRVCCAVTGVAAVAGVTSGLPRRTQSATGRRSSRSISLAVTTALTVLNQGIKHAGPGPAKKTTASDVVVPAIGLALYALSRHAERQKDIANGVNPDLPRDRLHAARVAAETARRAAASP